MRFTRQNLGVFLLVASLVYSALYLTSMFHPMALRMRAHGGVERAVVVALSSLTFKAVVLIAGAMLVFWPSEKK